MRQRGATLDLVCLELLAPAARELGRLWEQDECDFMQVTLALCRLHQLLRVLSAEFRGEEVAHELERRILLAPFPGEQHTFGVALVAEFLQRAGWEVWQELPSCTEEILKLVRRNWFAVIPESVRLGRRGRTVIQFAIAKDGSIPKLVIAVPSGADPLDRAAVAGVSASNPLPPLPSEFTGQQIRLQFTFSYNMSR